MLVSVKNGSEAEASFHFRPVTRQQASQRRGAGSPEAPEQASEHRRQPGPPRAFRQPPPRHPGARGNPAQDDGIEGGPAGRPAG